LTPAPGSPTSVKCRQAPTGLRTVERCVDISVRVACDPDAVAAELAAWWDGWLERFPAVLSEFQFVPVADQQIVGVDEASGLRQTFGATKS
jgi:hypothetical protein